MISKYSHLVFWCCVCVVVVVGLLLRVYALGEIPSGFHNDEMSFLFNAQLIWRTGADEDGRHSPLFLNSFIDPKPAILSYIQIPFLMIFSDPFFAARLPFAVMGFVSLFVVFAVLRCLGVSFLHACLVTTLLGISPWHIMVSRASHEVIAAFFFGMVAVLMLLQSLAKLDKKEISTATWLFVGVLVLSILAEHLYHSVKVVLPLILVVVSFTRLKRETFLIRFWWLFLIVITPLILVATQQSTLKRFADLSIFTKGDLQLILNEQISTATPFVSPLTIRVFHNKVVNSAYEISELLFEHLSADFLFFGESAPQRYVIPFHGLLYLVELPLLLIGIGVVIREKSLPFSTKFILFFWLLISPLPAAVTTQEVPSSIRAFWMLVPLMTLTSFGITGMLQFTAESLKLLGASLSLQRVFTGVSILFFVCGYSWSVMYLIHTATVFQPYYHPWTRNYADYQLALKLQEYSDQYQQVVITQEYGDPYIYLAFVGLIPAGQLQHSYPARLQESFSIGKYSFIARTCFFEKEAKTLFAMQETCELPDGFSRVDGATFRDGNNGYVLVEWSESGQ